MGLPGAMQSLQQDRWLLPGWQQQLQLERTRLPALLFRWILVYSYIHASQHTHDHCYCLPSTTLKISPDCLSCVWKTVLCDHFCICRYNFCWVFTSIFSVPSFGQFCSRSSLRWPLERADPPSRLLFNSLKQTPGPVTAGAASYESSGQSQIRTWRPPAAMSPIPCSGGG